jgi:hypothetical protein
MLALPWHPVRQEMAFSQWVAENPLPNIGPVTNHRICISTDPYDPAWSEAVDTDETTYSVSAAWFTDDET